LWLLRDTRFVSTKYIFTNIFCLVEKKHDIYSRFFSTAIL
jgi:hypothetical protein